MTRLFPILLILVLAATGVLAQGYGKAKSGLSDRTTNRVVRLLEQGLRQCRALESVYRYDCYRQNYQAAGKQLAGNPAYAPAQQALRDVEYTLANVVNANADPAAKPMRRRGKSFAAISEAAVPRSKAAFTAALDEATTQLLRSANSGGDHFARIASALDSDKVFLRS
ncbi:hypothetical protein [Sedimentitalea todarodis]|uniref:Uncharacterized protein n=1 Tax=Sedimentitalea todarodis TaxID=1631240 RepID=A0ABU3V7Z1_9RHOB|nr:hypothetical protein [Sedimentitalea todarodis]MDU9002289.1 hypothetical protein [Sedimentitalea todarodis]